MLNDCWTYTPIEVAEKKICVLSNTFNTMIQTKKLLNDMESIFLTPGNNTIFNRGGQSCRSAFLKEKACILNVKLAKVGDIIYDSYASLKKACQTVIHR